jgi:rhamnulokinase
MSYTQLTQLAREAKPFQAVIDPDDGAFFKPGDMPARIQAFCRRTGQAAPETPGGIIRCVLESLALKYRWALARLDEVVGGRLEPVHLVGGGTQNTLLNQLTADATGRLVLAGPIEATALGNVLMQLLALGEIASLQEGRELLRRSFALEEYLPSGEAKEAWENRYARLCELVES